ncbi:hypothetical protein [Streptomyces scabiei]|uniref:hypothetical protein n=1 Tax=Streptomyces scabiei TaxID=1930 RepID=UPI0029AC8D9B|nr:hypothetical protein [Streptomyces scabiei]MDX3279103.1 hypothetical protein [Streptomyces scabiei]
MMISTHRNVLGGTMRHTTALLAATLLLAALTACGTSSEDDKPAAKPSPSKTVNKDDQYLEVAREIAFNGAPSDGELLIFPELWCDRLESGHSAEWMFDMTGGGGLYPVGEEWGTAKADAYELLVAGVRAYCPENLDTVLEELRATGEY